MPTLCWLALMLLALALHELGHAAVALAQNADVEDVCLWPLGNFVVPMSPARSSDNLAIALAGPLVSGFLAFCSALVLAMAGASMVFNPFGSYLTRGLDSGTPFVDGIELAFSAVVRAIEAGRRPALVLPNPDLIYPGQVFVIPPSR